MNVDDVAGFDERVGEALAGPGPIFRREGNFGCADTGANLQRQHAGDHGMHVVAGAGFRGPIGMLVVLNGDAAGKDIFQLAGPALTHPAVPPLVDGEAVGDGAIGCFLEVQIERGFDLQAGLMHLFGSEAFLQLLPDLLLKPRGSRHDRRGNVQAERGVAGLLRLLV